MPKDLRTFIDEVAEKRPDEIVRVEREVDPKFELTAVVEKLEREGAYPAVYFEKVKGSNLPSIINLTASYERLAMALDTTLDQMVETFCAREENAIPPVTSDQVPTDLVTPSTVKLNPFCAVAGQAVAAQLSADRLLELHTRAIGIDDVEKLNDDVLRPGYLNRLVRGSPHSRGQITGARSQRCAPEQGREASDR